MPPSSTTPDRRLARPGAARRRAPLAGLALLLGLLALAAASAAATAADAPQARVAAAGPTYGEAMLAELNRIRAGARLPRVRSDRRMSRTAAAHSRDMVRRGYFAHGAWSSRVARAAGAGSAVGEVLGWRGRDTPRREAQWIVEGWLNSPPHRQVLFDAAFRRIGIGRATGGFGGTTAAMYTVDWASTR